MPTEPESQPSVGASKASSGENSDFTRLHITPLDADLLKIILPKSAVAQARNISYHTIETFPERRYGFVELPVTEAEKLKKKLNGSVLKGSKMRIEKARAEERTEPTGEVEVEEKKKKKSKDRSEESRKRKRDRDVVEGVVITDRKVKRGWTEPADQRRKKSRKDKEKEKDNEGKYTEKKKRLKSKYTEGDECLLKTKVPPNAVANISDEAHPKKRKKKGKGREITVHEFEKTTKFPSFLKSTVDETDKKPATEFVEGKGWVDEDGNVVEAVKVKAATPKPKKVAKIKPVVREPTPVEEDDDDSTSSSGTSSSGTSSDEEPEEEEDEKGEAEQEEQEEAATVPGRAESPVHPQIATPLSAIKADSSRPMSSSSTRSLTIKIPPPITPSAGQVHPLEALYKRNKAAGTETVTPAKEAEPFSFFGGDNEDEDIEDAPAVNVPMTPFTRQDFEWRNLRSAAPTPDTAHPSRMKNFWADEEEGEEKEEEEEMEDAPDVDGAQEDDEDDEKAPEQGASSDFQSWFWDNRRDLNRSWMKRRKTAAREKRHRENKARASRAV